MDLKPILDAPFAVKLHLATVVPAFALGTWLIFFSRKGAPVHRALGAIYLAHDGDGDHNLVRAPAHAEEPVLRLEPRASSGAVDVLRRDLGAVGGAPPRRDRPSPRDDQPLCRRHADRGRPHAPA